MRGAYQTVEEQRFAVQLGRRVEEIRTRFNVNFSYLGKIAGVQRDTVRRWERGETMPNPFQLHLLETFAAKKAVVMAKTGKKR